MRNSNLLKVVSAGILMLGIAVAPLSLPATAQTTQAQTVREDDGFDWGLLGLLGLIGLAGLAGKDRKSPTVYRDPGSSGSSY